jgi:C4-dicarboxylate transporter, DctM subunit
MNVLDPSTIGYLGIFVLLFLLVLGLHIGVALGAVGIIGTALMVGWGGALSLAVGSIYHQIAAFELLSVPLFVLMGYLSSVGGVSQDIYEALGLWVNRLKGGLGIATVASCTAFGTVCGSSLVTSVVFTKLSAPEMRKHGYDKKLAYGICSSSAMIGMLIPPSILLVVYGILAGESIGKLLISGVTPGLLLFVLFSLTIMAIGAIKPSMIQDSARREITWKERIQGIRKIWQVFLVVGVIFGGIFGGIFNPTEAAAVATAVLIALILFTRPQESMVLLKKAFQDTASTSGMIFLILGGSAVFSHFLTLTGITQSLAEYIIGMQFSKFVLLWVIMGFYGILGCFLDSISMLCITIPLFNPIIAAAKIDSIYYAVLVVMAIEIGLLTPPVGLNVYGSFAVAEKDVTIEDIFAGAFPFLIVSILSLAMLMYIPRLGTFLPSLMMGD